MRSFFYTEICAVLLAGAAATAEAAELSSEKPVAVLRKSGYEVSSDVVNLDIVNSKVSGSKLELEQVVVECNVPQGEDQDLSFPHSKYNDGNF